MRTLAISAIALFLTSACSMHRGAEFVVTQNGLEVTTTVHRMPARKRTITVRVRDAASRTPIDDAEVGIEELGLPLVHAHHTGSGSYEATFDEHAVSGSSSKSIGVAVLARGTNVVFHLKRNTDSIGAL